MLSGSSGGAGGIRTLDTLLTYTHFPGVRLRPLGHCSAFLFAVPQRHASAGPATRSGASSGGATGSQAIPGTRASAAAFSCYTPRPRPCCADPAFPANMAPKTPFRPRKRAGRGFSFSVAPHAPARPFGRLAILAPCGRCGRAVALAALCAVFCLASSAGAALRPLGYGRPQGS